MDPELYNAAINGSESFSEKIKSVDLNLRLTSQGNSLLHVAVKSGKKQIVEAILNSQPSVMYKTNFEGNTPLHIAASLGHLEMTQLLIDRAKSQEVEVHIELQELEVQNELLRMVNLAKDTPMHVAVKNDRYEIVDLLIREDRDLVLSTNSAGESPLFLAVDRGFYNIALHILKSIPEVSHEGRNKMNVLHAVAIRTHDYKHFKSIHKKEILMEKVSYALEALSLLNHTFNIINQFLHVGLKLSHLKFEPTRKFRITEADFVCQLLKKCSSGLSEKDEFGWIPLHYAAQAGNAKVVELFLEEDHHLGCIIIDKEGMSALHISAKEGHVDVMRTLITKCPEICELLDTRGRTALHVAVENGKRSAAKLLLETLAFQDLINKQDKEGNTPLHLAAVKGSFSVLLRLAQYSIVDKGATNKKGMTAMDIVPSNMQLKLEDIETGREDTSNMLKRMGYLPSLQQGVIREANRHEQSQELEHAKDEDVMDMAKTTDHQENESLNGKEKENNERIKEMAETNLLIATIIATVTFAAGVALPGGYNTNIDNLRTLSRNSTLSLQSNSLRGLVFSNSMAFSCSYASMFIHFFLSNLFSAFLRSLISENIHNVLNRSCPCFYDDRFYARHIHNLSQRFAAHSAVKV